MGVAVSEPARGFDAKRFAAVLESRPETMRDTLAYLNSRYGGALAYLEGVGLDRAAIRRLEGRLLEAAVS